MERSLQRVVPGGSLAPCASSQRYRQHGKPAANAAGYACKPVYLSEVLRQVRCYCMDGSTLQIQCMRRADYVLSPPQRLQKGLQWNGKF